MSGTLLTLAATLCASTLLTVEPTAASYLHHAVHWDAGAMDFAWDATHEKSEYVASGKFNVSKNIVTGIKVANRGEIFVTVPRWFAGVPATLNKVTLPKDGGTAQNPIFSPWPSWGMNEVGNCSALQYLQSMEIGNDGIMWALDVGLVNTIGGPVSTVCPPKMVFIDTRTAEIVGEPYVFPNDVLSHTTSFPNDLVIDNKAQVAYISDTSGDGGIVVFDRMKRTSRRYHDDTMLPDLSGDINWTMAGHHYPQGEAGFQKTPQDGIALSPDGTRLYYAALGAVGTYSLSTSALRKYCEFRSFVHACSLCSSLHCLLLYDPIISFLGIPT